MSIIESAKSITGEVLHKLKETDPQTRAIGYLGIGLLADIPWVANAIHRGNEGLSTNIEQAWQVIGTIGIPVGVAWAGIGIDAAIRHYIAGKNEPNK